MRGGTGNSCIIPAGLGYSANWEDDLEHLSIFLDPQLLARGMIAEHWDERVERNVRGPGVVPVLSETPGTIRTAGPARPGQHNDEIYRGLLGKTHEELAAMREEGVL